MMVSGAGFRFGSGRSFPVAFCVFFSIVAIIDANPVIIDLENFNDDWDYQVKPDDLPRLNQPVKIHELPPTTPIKRYEHYIQRIKPRKAKKKIVTDVIRSRVSCGSCKIGVGLLSSEVKKGSTFDAIKNKFVSLCVALNIETGPVCTGIFDTYGPQVVPVLNVTHLAPLEICSLVLGEVCGDVEIQDHEWTVEFSDVPKPNWTIPAVPKAGTPTFKVLHLSDTHFDPEYAPGSPSNCEEPLCCRSYSTPSKKEKMIPAGRWGAYRSCDSPGIIIENMLTHIAKEHPDIDYIIWTGDLPPHDIWNQTKESNLEIIQTMAEMMSEIFPNTPIFPALGNHEAIPAGSFAPPWMKDDDLGISWLYTKVAENWKKWLPESAENTVMHGGFFSVLLRPGFRLISLNTNYCHSLSWWLLVNSTDPAQELKWLVYQLQEAENNDEKVHIIGHIPPGSSDCMKTWSANFNRIVNRYENIITGQFYGHSHADEFEVFYDMPENSRATNVAYLGPSVTTYDNYNPAYRIYYVDGDHNATTREVIDHETWTMDLDLANEGDNEPIWYRLYSAKSAYGFPSLRPAYWSKLITDMVGDEYLFNDFYKFYYRDSPTRPKCNEQCRLQILCDLRSAKSNSRRELCHDLEVEFGALY
ncbi:sphingomyelin phosphodiesterase [Aethina tumida]|uniref:sphingomyelin phosphodiesterase n=1 Tax=Aethina tumida TaxID=116153 RepID=UPI00096B3155|nr:sphingomyelin phosphodiesterase [Aethina tumida]